MKKSQVGIVSDGPRSVCLSPSFSFCINQMITDAERPVINLSVPDGKIPPLLAGLLSSTELIPESGRHTGGYKGRNGEE